MIKYNHMKNNNTLHICKQCGKETVNEKYCSYHCMYKHPEWRLRKPQTRKWTYSLKYREQRRKSMNKPENIAKFKLRMHNPITMAKSLKHALTNSFGHNCYSDAGEFFPSLQERTCYMKLKSIYTNRLIHNFKGRFDFAIPDMKLIIEYHPFNKIKDSHGNTFTKYKNSRLKLFKVYDIVDWRLIIFKNLKDVDDYCIKAGN